MLKNITDGFARVFTPQRLLTLIIFIVFAWMLLSYADEKSLSLEGVEDGSRQQRFQQLPQLPEFQQQAPDSRQQGGAEIASSSELLPTDQNSQWASLNPVNMNGGNIMSGDLLQAGYHIGLDTIGQTMKNANLQLRSDPIIPKIDVGPWNQSTYEPDYARVPLEIGACSK
jgi:hypothetical protein